VVVMVEEMALNQELLVLPILEVAVVEQAKEHQLLQHQAQAAPAS
jgi:hypothetical protein